MLVAGDTRSTAALEFRPRQLIDARLDKSLDHRDVGRPLSSARQSQGRGMITIVDYGTSNLGSMRNMLKKLGVKSTIASCPQVLDDAAKIIVPGVGSFDAGMKKLTESGMLEVLTRKATVEKVPVLGVCLGMQLMTRGSEEGRLSGLGWIDGKTVGFRRDVDPGIRIPHMGWNSVQASKKSAVLEGLQSAPRFYFAHSFFVSLVDSQDLLLEAAYGSQSFAAAFEKDNLVGVQFHPEKSHRYGMLLIRNFAEST